MENASGISFAGQSLRLDTASDAAPIIEAIQNCPKIDYLCLEGNSLGVDAAQAISEVLKKRSEFKCALWKDMFTGRLKTEIPIALSHLGQALMHSGCRLTVLDISDNAMGPIGIEGLLSLLSSSCCYSLEELRLSNLGLGVTGGKKLASALENLYQSAINDGQTLKLKVFVAGRNRLENVGASALASFFAKITTLEEFAVPQNGIYHAGIDALCVAFSRNKSLKVINLNDNTITPKGAVHLRVALPLLKNLEVLDLGDCLLKSRGGMEIASAIELLTNLRKVDVSSNELSSEAGMMLVNAVRSSSCSKPINRSSLGGGSDDHSTSNANFGSVTLLMDGNCFGGCCETIKEIAAAIQADLGTLSNDEGDSDEEESGDFDSEEEAEVEEDIDEEEEEDFLAEVVIEEDDDDEYGGTSDVPNYQSTLEEFKKNGVGFNLLAPNQGSRIISLLQVRHYPTEYERMKDIIKVLVMVANIDMANEGDTVREALVEACAALGTFLMEWTGGDTEKIMYAVNTLCAYIGYVKAEESFPVNINRDLVICMLRNANLDETMWRIINYCHHNPTRS